MKKRNIFHLLLVGLLLSGCSAEIEQGPTDGAIPITLGYSVVMATGQTRAGTTLNNDALTTGSVAVSVKKSTAGAYPAAKTYTAGAGGALTPPSASNQFFYETDGSTSDIIAYYPSTASTTFSVETNQTEDEDYQASDLMWAQVPNQLPTNSSVNLPFSHKMSKIVVNAEAGIGITSITSVTLNKVKPKVTFDPTDGTVDLASSDNDPTDITMENGGAALIPPQIIDGNLITIVTPEGTAKYSVDNKEFESGHQYTFNITVNATDIKMNPLWYVAPYNMTAANTMAGTANAGYYYTWSNAMTNFAAQTTSYSDYRNANKTISGQSGTWHLPVQGELLSIIPGINTDIWSYDSSGSGTYKASYVTAVFGCNSTTKAGISESSYWKRSGTELHAIRFLGTPYCSAWKYVWSGSTLIISATLINQVENTSVAAASWYSRKWNTVTFGEDESSFAVQRTFYSCGYAGGNAVSAGGQLNSYGYYWSTTTTSGGSPMVLRIDTGSAVRLVSHSSSYGFSVRLFRDN